MNLVVAPDPWMPFTGRKVFLAGGITGCEDWQSLAVEELRRRFPNPDVTVFNPRRLECRDDPDVAREQIRWEHVRLRAADDILFWFPKESVCPITLFELGVATLSAIWGGPSVHVAADPEYPRLLDLQEQLYLADDYWNGSPPCATRILPGTLGGLIDAYAAFVRDEDC